MTDLGKFTKPPVSPEDMTDIEAGHMRVEAMYWDIEWTSEGRQAHAHRGSLIEQLNYTAAVIISIQLELTRIKDLLKYAQRGLGEA